MLASVRVLRKFYDTVAKSNRMPGETFDVEQDRAACIESRLGPGYVEVTLSGDEAGDLASMRVGELRDLCEGRGIEVPKGAKKADLLALLGE